MSLCLGLVCFVAFLPFIAFLGTVAGDRLHARRLVIPKEEV